MRTNKIVNYSHHQIFSLEQDFLAKPSREKIVVDD
jgi:hypothetical protein